MTLSNFSRTSCLPAPPHKSQSASRTSVPKKLLCPRLSYNLKESAFGVGKETLSLLFVIDDGHKLPLLIDARFYARFAILSTTRATKLETSLLNNDGNSLTYRLGKTKKFLFQNV